MATVLYLRDDAISIKQKAAAKKSFNNKFFKAQTGVYSTGSQTSMAMPLCVGLVDDKNKKSVIKILQIQYVQLMREK